jgi:hypothetical protein
MEVEPLPSGDLQDWLLKKISFCWIRLFSVASFVPRKKLWEKLY